MNSGEMERLKKERETTWKSQIEWWIEIKMPKEATPAPKTLFIEFRKEEILIIYD